MSVQVAAGETLGIVGESGSGKTTLAKLFLLLERPTAGTLLFDGQDLLAFSKAELQPYRRAVQAVLLGSLQLVKPAHAGGRQCGRAPTSRGRPESYIGALTRGEVLSLVGLSKDSASLYPHEFSGGQRQRIAIARALVTYPSVLFWTSRCRPWMCRFGRRSSIS